MRLLAATTNVAAAAATSNSDHRRRVDVVQLREYYYGIVTWRRSSSWKCCRRREGKGGEGNTTQCVLCGFQGRSLVQYSRSGCLLIKSLHTTIRHDSHVGMQYSNILLHHRHHYLTGVTHRSHLLIFRRRDQNQSLLDLLLFP